MSSGPNFYLPVILPPTDESNVAGYYSTVSAQTSVTLSFAATGDNLEIAITNAEQKHPDGKTPYASVIAPTAGFVSFYRHGKAVPFPSGTTIGGIIAPPSGLGVGEEATLGSLLLRVWFLDYLDFGKTSSGASKGVNRILLYWLRVETIKDQLKLVIANLPETVLKAAWEKDGGQGVPTTNALIDHYLTRFMDGDFELFVPTGTVLGWMYASSSNPQAGKFGILAFFQDATPNIAPVSVDAEDVLGPAIRRPVFAGHPLANAANSPISVHFLSTLKKWDSNSKTFVPFAGSAKLISNDSAALLSQNDVVEANVVADSAGKLNFTVSLQRRRLIRFECATTPKSITVPHRARKFVDSNGTNQRVYEAFHDIYTSYVEFIDSLDPDAEQFLQDRGNAGRDNFAKKGLSFSSQTYFLDEMKRFEDRYQTERGQNLFTVLFEGDSWLSYPPVGYLFGKEGPGQQQPGDIYGHLTRTFQEGLLKPFKYVHWPLQHHGDRSDQMFEGADNDPGRQWHHTLRILKQRKVDVIICSSGGNDMAEPGISHWLIFPGVLVINPKNKSPLIVNYQKCFPREPNKNPTFEFDGSGSYFNPLLMNDFLTSDQKAIATGLMNRSFAILLKDHPWSLFKDGPQPPIVQTPQPIVPVGADKVLLDSYGSLNDELDQIGKKVAADPGRHQERKDLFLKYFDKVRYEARLGQVELNWRKLIQAAQENGAVIVTHTYCYPLFSEEFTKHHIRITGPWFAPRFLQAGIDDKRIRAVCLRVIIDDYKTKILDKLENEFQGTFSVADVRSLNDLKNDWNDEMHLSREGFKRVAEKIFEKVKYIGPQQERFPGVLK